MVVDKRLKKEIKKEGIKKEMKKLPHYIELKKKKKRGFFVFFSVLHIPAIARDPTRKTHVRSGRSRPNIEEAAVCDRRVRHPPFRTPNPAANLTVVWQGRPWSLIWHDHLIITLYTTNNRIYILPPPPPTHTHTHPSPHKKQYFFFGMGSHLP